MLRDWSSFTSYGSKNIFSTRQIWVGAVEINFILHIYSVQCLQCHIYILSTIYYYIHLTDNTEYELEIEKILTLIQSS